MNHIISLNRHVPYSESKLNLNLKKVELECCKKLFSYV